MSLDGRAVLVTGGSRRIGKAIALALARAGTDVAISCRSHRADAQKVAKAIERMDRRSIAVRADLTRPSNCRRLVETAAASLGQLDILVNNVGEWVVKPVETMDLATWHRILD